MSILKQLINENWFNKQFDLMDDDLSPAERELVKRSEKDLKAKGINVDHEPEMLIRKKEETKKPAIKPQQKQEIKPQPKTEAKPEEVQKAKHGDKSNKAREWIKSNPQGTRRTFIEYATKQLGVSVPHANTMFYSLKKRLTEYYIVSHPSKDTHVLCEYDSFTTKWTEFENPKAKDAMIFESEDEAFNALEEIGAGKVVKIVIE